MIGSLLDDLNRPFGMLAGYIFGGNTKRTAAGTASADPAASSSVSEKVAMTSPVLMTQHRKSEPGGAAGAGNEKVAMTSPVLMTQQQLKDETAGQGAKAVKKMVIYLHIPGGIIDEFILCC